MSQNILDKIVAHKLTEVTERKARVDQRQLQDQIEAASAPRGFKQQLQLRASAGQAAVIAEIKKASPSQGVIRETFLPAEIAVQYEKAGAACLSVLTDEQFFQGNDSYLGAARGACALPVLRKDFIIDAYQVYEARALDADCVLLIVSILSDAQLAEYHQLALELGMNVLVEVHDGEEMTRALKINPDILGINNRNLKTFEVSLATTLTLKAAVDPEIAIITESGIRTSADVETMLTAGVFGFLVGETFMRHANPGEKLSELFFC